MEETAVHEREIESIKIKTKEKTRKEKYLYYLTHTAHDPNLHTVR